MKQAVGCILLSIAFGIKAPVDIPCAILLVVVTVVGLFLITA